MIWPQELTEGLAPEPDGNRDNYPTTTIYVTDGRGRIDLMPLDPSRRSTITLTVQTGNHYQRITPTLTVQGHTRQIETIPASETFELDPYLERVITIDGFTPGTKLDVNVETELPPITSGAENTPHRIGLIAYVPRREYAPARLGTARLGGFHLPSPIRSCPWFRLGSNRLGYGTLSTSDDYHGWTSILAPVTQIDTHRAIDWNGITGRGDVGIMTVTIYNQLDPRASGLIRGVTVQLLDNVTRARLFTGTIAKIVSNPRKDGTYTLTLEIHDHIAAISGVKKYQETTAVNLTWTDYLRKNTVKDIPALPSGLTGSPIWIKDQEYDRPRIGAVKREATLTAYIDALAATVGATWWVDPAGIVRFRLGPEASPAAYIDMGEAAGNYQAALPYRDWFGNLEDRVISPTNANATFDTSSALSGVNAINHTITLDNDGGTDGTTTTISVDAPTNAAAYGVNPLEIDTMAADVDQLRQSLAWLLESYEPAQVITSATFDPLRAPHATPGKDLTTLTGIDLANLVGTRYRGALAWLMVTGISHTITPTSWTTTLDLNYRKDFDRAPHL